MVTQTYHADYHRTMYDTQASSALLAAGSLVQEDTIVACFTFLVDTIRKFGNTSRSIRAGYESH